MHLYLGASSCPINRDRFTARVFEMLVNQASAGTPIRAWYKLRVNAYSAGRHNPVLIILESG
jgi:hypothetical protein